MVGAEFGIWRGIRQWVAPEPVVGFSYAYLILAGAFALQASSVYQALLFLRRRAAEREVGVVGLLLSTSDAQLRAAVVEDVLALIGLLVAAAALGLRQATGRTVFDAGGSILIGLLMGCGGLFLIDRNRRFLAGMPLPPASRARVIAILRAAPEIRRVTAFFAEYIGPGKVMISARVELAGEHDQKELARTLRRLERRIMADSRFGRVALTLAAPEEEDLI